MPLWAGLECHSLPGCPPAGLSAFHHWHKPGQCTLPVNSFALVLCSTGEDQGDAHYLYENTGAFPFLRANNKAVRRQQQCCCSCAHLACTAMKEAFVQRRSGWHAAAVGWFTACTLAAPGGPAEHISLCACSSPMQDVRSWLEGIIERSKDRAGVHGHLVQVCPAAAAVTCSQMGRCA